MPNNNDFANLILTSKRHESVRVRKRILVCADLKRPALNPVARRPVDEKGGVLGFSCQAIRLSCEPVGKVRNQEAPLVVEQTVPQDLSYQWVMSPNLR
jgi:hypothetical protein